MSEKTPHAGRRRLIVLAATLVVGLGAGLGIARLLTGASDSTGPEEPAAEARQLPEGDFPAPAPPAGDAGAPAAEATTPEAAVEGFLTAEANREFEASYEYLSQADREVYPSAAQWVAAHADLPTVTGFSITEVNEDEVTTQTALDSGLNQIVGLVPARALATWSTTEQDGVVRVVFRDTVLQPRYPDEAGVTAAVEEWAAARLNCETTGQYEGTIIGQPILGDQLCDAEGELELGTAGVLTDDPSATPLLNAFGPEVFTWARVVDVRAPTEMRVVTAPIDDTWKIVGVLPPPGGPAPVPGSG